MGPKKDQNNFRIKTIKCPYYDSGYYKYGDKCHNIHPDKVCNDNNCSEDKCDKRHPNPCKFGKRRRHSKKNVCSYAHVSFASDDKKFEELENEIKVLEDNLKKKSKELENSIFNEIKLLKKTVEDKDL